MYSYCGFSHFSVGFFVVVFFFISVTIALTSRCDNQYFFNVVLRFFVGVSIKSSLLDTSLPPSSLRYKVLSKVINFHAILSICLTSTTQAILFCLRSLSVEYLSLLSSAYHAILYSWHSASGFRAFVLHTLLSNTYNLKTFISIIDGTQHFATTLD